MKVISNEYIAKMPYSEGEICLVNTGINNKLIPAFNTFVAVYIKDEPNNVFEIYLKNGTFLNI
jgi:hypothetical protein